LTDGCGIIIYVVWCWCCGNGDGCSGGGDGRVGGDRGGGVIMMWC